MMKLTTSALSILVLLGASPAPARGQESPSTLRVLPGELDLGRHPAGTDIDRSGWVLNDGDEPVLLQRVTATCGCTTARLSPTTLPPRAALHVPLHVTAPKAPGVSKSVAVTFFAEGRTPVKLPVQVASEADGSAEPSTPGEPAPDPQAEPAAEAARQYLGTMMPTLSWTDFRADGAAVTAVAWSADFDKPVGLVTCRMDEDGRVESVLLESIATIGVG